MPHKIFSAWVPHYAWLAESGFVEEPPRRPGEGWGTMVDLVGSQFTVRFVDDYGGPAVSVGSDALGWEIPAYVIQYAAPGTLPNYPEEVPSPEEEADQFREHLADMIELYQHGDLLAMQKEIRRRQRIAFDRAKRVLRESD